jgi:ferric-dicitrate binding protein FerR (iron transport regulator)
MRNDIQNSDNRDDDAALSKLLNLAGPPEQISGAVEGRVYARVRSEWSQSSRPSQVVRWGLPLALAATVLIAFFISSPGTKVEVRSIGSVLASGQEVFVGDVIDTSTGGGMSVWLDGDISLRIDENTQLQVAAINQFTLMAGRVYVDTGDRIYATRHITVETASGKATDIGTQFSVSYEKTEMSVAVREGRVELSDGHANHNAAKGEKLTLRPGRTVEFDTVPIAGPEWEWAVALAPAFVLQDHSLLEFLKWAARETGMNLVFDSGEVRAAARVSRSYGSIDGLTPLEAVEAVLATTQFDYSIDGNTISIGK